MKIKISLVLVSLFIFMSFKTPKEISNKDLRASSTVVSIKDMNNNEFKLNLSPAGQYFVSSINKNSESMQKLANNIALKIDEDFVSLFIHIKYMMPKYEGKKCDISYQLYMRGEDLDICSNEKEKNSKSKKLIAQFKKYFSN